MNTPRAISSGRPFVRYAEKYLAMGFSPIPLPPGKKNPPPTGFTGHGRPFVDAKQLQKWFNDPDSLKYPAAKANIGLRLNTIDFNGELFDLVGIDVDHHPEDPDDPKDGGTQLKSLEKIYGKLPDTWTSSARTNGIAGIRFYLAPRGLSWRGDCGKDGPDIDIISKNYRFAVCFPSTNPDANNRQYWWYPPGFAPNGDIDVVSDDVPDPRSFAKLPEKWVDFLTQGGIPDLGVEIDMESSNQDLIRWANKKFGDSKNMCGWMEAALDRWKKRLEESAKSHNVLTDAHYNMLKAGANEKHGGWVTATKDFETAYVATCVTRKKRREREAIAEIKRSRFGALRRIKGEADSAGAGYFDRKDACALIDNFKVIPPSKFGNGFPEFDSKDPDDYELNDDGNAEHFLDIHKDMVLFVSNVLQRWIIWNGERWIVDERDDIARHLYRRVKIRQVQFAKQAMADYLKVAGAPGSGKLRQKAMQWQVHAKNSGMTNGIARALEAARSVRQGVSIKYEDLNKDRRAIGVANGVIRFKKGGGIEMISNDKSLLITKNTGVPYIPLIEQKDHPEYKLGYQLFTEFLAKFIRPSIDLRYFQKHCGSALIGDNYNKAATFFWGEPDTGKTTMLNLMVKAVGEYGCYRNPDIFKSTHLNPALASALSMRIVGVAEMGDNEINSDLFKSITGGESITCELKGKNNLIEDDAQFNLFITSNGVPNVPKEDKAFRNRVRVVEFKHHATERELKDGKQTQRDLYRYGSAACLAWLVEGCSLFESEGLDPIPDEMLVATDEFNSRLSEIGIFANEWIAREEYVTNDKGVIEQRFVTNEDLLSHFEAWSHMNNFDVKGWSSTRLTQRLKDLGYKTGVRKVSIEGSTKKVSSRGIWGIKLVKGKH